MRLHLLLSRNHHSLVVLVPQSEGRTFRLAVQVTVEIRPRGWIILHVPFHPFWELFFSTEAKSSSLRRIRLEAGV